MEFFELERQHAVVAQIVSNSPDFLISTPTATPLPMFSISKMDGDGLSL